MADSIKIGNYEVSSFKVGSGDCKIYLGDVLLYPKNTPHDYNNDYFTFVALETGTFTVNGGSIEYSLNDGSTWTTLTAGSSTPTVTSGGKVLWRGSYSGSTSSGGTVHFASSGRFNAEGNTMSLLYGDNFIGQTSLGDSIWTFNSLFSGATGLISVENMKLPATTVTQRCYNNIFSGCTSLTTAPEFPATTLGDACYQGMFNTCTSFEHVPENIFSAATIMADRCYTNTFWLSGIKNLPKLPSTSLAVQCYSGIFVGCTGITSVPDNYLPATTLPNNCYFAMFSGCTSLSLVPADLLHATTVSSASYGRMFQGCTSLTTAPSLPATTLGSQCYANMFNGCTNLTTAPVLPATTLVSGCYNYMFQGCTKLNYIKAMFTTRPNTTYTNAWVNGVASTGTFVKNSAATWSVTCGTSTVPCNWTITTASS